MRTVQTVPTTARDDWSEQQLQIPPELGTTRVPGEERLRSVAHEEGSLRQTCKFLLPPWPTFRRAEWKPVEGVPAVPTVCTMLFLISLLLTSWRGHGFYTGPVLNHSRRLIVEIGHCDNDSLLDVKTFVSANKTHVNNNRTTVKCVLAATPSVDLSLFFFSLPLMGL